MRKVFAAPEVDTIESFDLDRGHGFAAGVVRQNETEEKRLAIHVWEKPDVEAETPTSSSGDDQARRKLPTTSVLRYMIFSLLKLGSLLYVRMSFSTPTMFGET